MRNLATILLLVLLCSCGRSPMHHWEHEFGFSIDLPEEFSMATMATGEGSGSIIFSCGRGFATDPQLIVRVEPRIRPLGEMLQVQEEINAAHREDLGEWFADTLANSIGLGRRIVYTIPGLEAGPRLIEDLRVYPWRERYYSFFFRYPEAKPEWQTRYSKWMRDCYFHDTEQR